MLWFPCQSSVWVPLDVGYVRTETRVELTVSDCTPPVASVPTTSSLYDILGDVFEYVCAADDLFTPLLGRFWGFDPQNGKEH